MDAPADPPISLNCVVEEEKILKGIELVLTDNLNEAEEYFEAMRPGSFRYSLYHAEVAALVALISCEGSDIQRAHALLTETETLAAQLAHKFRTHSSIRKVNAAVSNIKSWALGKISKRYSAMVAPAVKAPSIEAVDSDQVVDPARLEEKVLHHRSRRARLWALQIQAECHLMSSILQAMIRPSPALHGFMPDNAYGAMPVGGSNPMYGNISVQPGFQCAAGSYGMPGANMGMAGFSQRDAQNLNMVPCENFGSGMPLLNAPVYDNLTPKGKLKDYKEVGQAVKFDNFHGTHDKLKALLFLQQFDAAFAGGNFTESPKIRKAATFLKTNALQWWTTLLNQGVAPSTWVQFKQIFAPAYTFEIVDAAESWSSVVKVGYSLRCTWGLYQHCLNKLKQLTKEWIAMDGSFDLKGDFKNIEEDESSSDSDEEEAGNVIFFT
ncbi:hypothetical protein L7F22_023279 [Adiantum nelumboides]|nr:hypothetical protein [Adiantum nelumboides]